MPLPAVKGQVCLISSPFSCADLDHVIPQQRQAGGEVQQHDGQRDAGAGLQMGWPSSSEVRGGDQLCTQKLAQLPAAGNGKAWARLSGRQPALQACKLPVRRSPVPPGRKACGRAGRSSAPAAASAEREYR